MTASKVYNTDGDVVIVLPQLSDYCRRRLASVLESAFTWGGTEEGYDYWHRVKLALEHGDYDDVPSNTAKPDDEHMLTFRWTGGGNKVNAIKLWRSLAGVGLKEAKDAVERGDTLRVSLHEASIKLRDHYGSNESAWGAALYAAGWQIT